MTLSYELQSYFYTREGETAMTNQRTIGIIMLVVGAIVLAVSLGADVFGLGGDIRFGIRQILGTVVGILLLGVGFVYSRK
jgi:hypothetical protein